MIATVILVFLWLIICIHVSGAFLTLCRVVRYKNIFVNLDADRIAHQPFQPKISLVVRGDLATVDGAVGRIQELLSLNYTRYEVILITDAGQQPEEFEWLLDYFDLQPAPLSGEMDRLDFPVTAIYHSRERVFGRLTVVDKPFHDDEDLRRTGAAICKADYMLFLRSLNNELVHNSLSRLAILKMRHPSEHITPIRGTARYDCGKRVSGNIFRSLADLCNLRRLYITGAFRASDFGQFLLLEDISGRRGSEEFVPRPQMYLHRPNRLATYFGQLAPDLRHMTFYGRLISWMELLFGVLFWVLGLRLMIPFHFSYIGIVLLLVLLLLPLVASTFSIFVGEVLLKKEKPRIGLILRLVLLSFPEALLFCLLTPVAWAVNRLAFLCRRCSTAG